MASRGQRNRYDGAELAIVMQLRGEKKSGAVCSR